jgi:hypothetical protein
VLSLCGRSPDDNPGVVLCLYYLQATCVVRMFVLSLCGRSPDDNPGVVLPVLPAGDMYCQDVYARLCSRSPDDNPGVVLPVLPAGDVCCQDVCALVVRP